MNAQHLPGLLSPAAHEIAHPCDRWARAAGYSSWRAALLAMKEEGRVLCAHTSQIDSGQSKSNLSFQLFMDEIAAQDLHTCSEGGFVYLGLKSRFCPDMLDRQERELARFEQRLSRMARP